MVNFAYAVTPRLARSDPLAVLARDRFGVGKGTTMPIGGSGPAPVAAAASRLRMRIADRIPRRGPVQPTAFGEFDHGVLADVCPGHRSWSPPD